MRMYLVGIRTSGKVAHLVAYESKDLAENRKTGVGLSYQNVLSCQDRIKRYNYEPVFQSRNKQECIDYMEKNLKPYGWRCLDLSGQTQKLQRGKKMYAVVGSWAAGEIEEIIEYHSGNPHFRIPGGYYSRVIFDSTRKDDCMKFIKQFYKEMEQL